MIGDGSKIKVMFEPWLRSEGKGWENASQGQGVYNINVNNLMLNNVKQYDAHKIKQIFTHDATKEILDVPLFDDVGEDSLVWKEEQNGDYNVKLVKRY